MFLNKNISTNPTISSCNKRNEEGTHIVYVPHTKNCSSMKQKICFTYSIFIIYGRKELPEKEKYVMHRNIKLALLRVTENQRKRAFFC